MSLDKETTDTTNLDRIMRGLNEVVDIVEGKALPAQVHAPIGTDATASGDAKD